MQGRYIDINGLKTINDTYGHNEGDALICAMYNFLLEVFPEDTIFRMGGDEFVVLENKISEEAFLTQIQRLRELTRSMGMLEFACGYHWTSGKEDIREALKIADENMYQDKQKFYTHTTGRKGGHDRLCLEDSDGLTDGKCFHEMLEQGRFVVHLQPIVDGKDGTLRGAEALVRYVRENGELVSAADFISLLETTHYISELDRYVFQQTCRLIHQWIAQGLPPVPVAVNISRHTLSTPGFLEEMIKLWETCPVPKEYLELEITENTLLECGEIAEKIVKNLKAQGFSIALDDFGIERTNLQSLLHMDFDVLKMDKSIIAAMMDTGKTYLLLKGVVNICHDMGARIVAEGVENQEQATMLTELHMDALQGYYFSPPLAPESFAQAYLHPAQAAL